VSGVPILVEAGAVRVLVVGGGAVAARKAAAFRDAGARVRIVASRLSDAVRAMAADGSVEVVERGYAPGDIGDAQLVIAATDDRAVNAAIAADARASHRLVNVADAPGDGSFATMATHRSGALVLGVSAGGVPGAAARIRDAIAIRFDSRYARALADLSTMRRALLDRGDGPSWRALSASVIDEGFCDVVERETLSGRVSPWR
jgi:precorrin-2 dehydrogenase/sirohydrochlorin ferrochelatase